MRRVRGVWQRILVSRGPNSYVERAINELAESPHAFVLDVGAGHAPWRSRFEVRSRYVALDISYSPELDVIGTLTALPILPHSVGLVVATEVLEHVDSPADALLELHRVLVDGGLLLLSVPLVYGEHDTVDYHRWTASGLAALFKRHGFRLVRVSRKGGIFRLFATLIDEMPYQLLVSKTVRYDSMSGRQKLAFVVASFSRLLLSPMVWIIGKLDVLDRNQRFTVGYICVGKKEC